MNHPLLLTALGLFFVLVAIERLASRALRLQEAIWHAHYAAIPTTATITAELQWKNAMWITAYVDALSVPAGSLQVVALRPLSSRDHSACLRWLRAEGFADVATCRMADNLERWPSESGI